MTPSNANLIPTHIVDKNGKTTTVHKKAVSAASGSVLSGIAPQKPASNYSVADERTFTPNAKQLKQRYFALGFSGSTVDRRLPEGKRGRDAYEYVNEMISEVEVYDVMSVVRDHVTAAVLIREGVRSAEEASAYLKERNAEPLLEDHSELAQKALARRVDAQTLVEFGKYYNPALWHSGSHLDRYLDAVEAYSVPSLQKRRGPLFSDILNGEIRWSDMKTIGIRRCAIELTSDTEIRILKSLADGSSNFTAEQLGAAFRTADGHHDTYQNISWMSQKHGGEWASGINWSVGIIASRAYRQRRPDRLVDFDEERAFVEYADRYMKHSTRKMEDVLELFKAGVKVDFALQHSDDPDRYTPQQLAAMQEGITPPLTGGWL